MSILRNLVGGAVLAGIAATAAVPAAAMPLSQAPASAVQVQNVDYWSHGHYYRGDPGAALALGVFALTAAAIAAGASQPAYACPGGYVVAYNYGQPYCAPAPAYYAAPPAVVYQDEPAYYDAPPVVYGAPPAYPYPYRGYRRPHVWGHAEVGHAPRGPHVVYYRASHPLPSRGAPPCRHYEQCR
ncbi:MAG: hypothetical protein KGI57_12995 [Hyphomicrobiales bacterium]|nr:hypothetical protein [Hyphomicrobiales bacterium]